MHSTQSKICCLVAEMFSGLQHYDTIRYDAHALKPEDV